MWGYRRKILLILFKLSDGFLLSVSMLAVYWLLNNTPSKFTSLYQLLLIRISLGNIIFITAMLLIWHIIFMNLKLYSSRRLERSFSESKDIIKATSIGTIIFFLGGKVFFVAVFTPLFCLTFWIVSSFLTILFRVVLRYSLRKIRKSGRNLRPIIIVGTNKRALAIAKMFKKHEYLGYMIHGFIDDTIHESNKIISVIGKLKDFDSILRHNVIDEVFITLPIKSHYESIQRIIWQAEEQGVSVRIFSNFFDTYPKEEISFSPQSFHRLTVYRNCHDERGIFIKRLVDILISTTLLIITAPIMLLSAAAIKLTSRGPVFFVQERVGFRKRIFRIYKFRTMISNAESLKAKFDSLNEMDGPVFKIKNDPRVTRVGKWLRITSIDELPQLFNVVKGDMSMVGPRPLPLSDYQGFSEDWQRRRFSVRPGITCIWQVTGRNAISFQKWMELDMQYIDEWSIELDIKLLLKTIPAVLRGSGAS